MTKTVCDICGKEMPSIQYAENNSDLNFSISSYGRIWDICSQCRVNLWRWMQEQKESSDAI